MLKPWQFLAQRLLAETRIFRILAENWRSPRTQGEHVFTNIDAPDWVNVVALDEQERMVLVRQFRFGSRAFTLETPGGMCDPGEEPRTTALRELREETGYSGERVTDLGYVYPNPAIMNNRIHMFLVEGCRPSGELVLDAGEDIEVALLPVDKVLEMLHTGAVDHALVAVALHRFELYRSGALRLSASTLPNAAKLGTKP